MIFCFYLLILYLIKKRCFSHEPEKISRKKTLFTLLIRKDWDRKREPDVSLGGEEEYFEIY